MVLRLVPLAVATFGDIAALGLEVRVWCTRCKQSRAVPLTGAVCAGVRWLPLSMHAHSMGRLDLQRWWVSDHPAGHVAADRPRRRPGGHLLRSMRAAIGAPCRSIPNASLGG
jgi:hypothetical protein